MRCFDANETVSALVADTVLKLMHKGGTGEVLMVNSAGVYLSTDDQVWLLCDISCGAVPIGIAIDGFAHQIKRLCLEQGQKFCYRENRLIFSGRTLKLQPVIFNENQDCFAKPQLYLINQAAQDIVNLRKERGISMLVLPLVLGLESHDIAALNPYCTKAYPLFSRLIQALSSDAESEVCECVGSLLGLGVGLTPSADDVMLGMLYAFRKLVDVVPKSVDTFRASIFDKCDIRTNRVSAAYLKAVLSGAYFERIDQVWRGLCGLEPLDTTVLTEVGSSSGAEMLLGVLIALRVCGYSII